MNNLSTNALKQSSVNDKEYPFLKKNFLKKVYGENLFNQNNFFFLGFLLQPLTNHRTAGERYEGVEGGGGAFL